MFNLNPNSSKKIGIVTIVSIDNVLGVIKESSTKPCGVSYINSQLLVNGLDVFLNIFEFPTYTSDGEQINSAQRQGVEVRSPAECIGDSWQGESDETNKFTPERMLDPREWLELKNEVINEIERKYPDYKVR